MGTLLGSAIWVCNQFTNKSFSSRAYHYWNTGLKRTAINNTFSGFRHQCTMGTMDYHETRNTSYVKFSMWARLDELDIHCKFTSVFLILKYSRRNPIKMALHELIRVIYHTCISNQFKLWFECKLLSTTLASALSLCSQNLQQQNLQCALTLFSKSQILHAHPPKNVHVCISKVKQQNSPNLAVIKTQFSFEFWLSDGIAKHFMNADVRVLNNDLVNSNWQTNHQRWLFH